MKLLKLLLFIILFNFCFSPYLKCQIKDTILSNDRQIIKPNKNLMLWFGTQFHKIDKVIFLGEYAILYDEKISTFYLINNFNHLLADTYDMSKNKIIEKVNFVTKDKQKFKTVIPSLIMNHTIQDKNNVFVYPLKIKNKWGYAHIKIENGKMHVENHNFSIQNKKNVDNIYSISFFHKYMETETYGFSKSIFFGSEYGGIYTLKNHKINYLYEIKKQTNEKLQAFNYERNIYFWNIFDNSIIKIENEKLKTYTFNFFIDEKKYHYFLVDELSKNIYFCVREKKLNEKSISQLYKLEINDETNKINLKLVENFEAYNLLIEAVIHDTVFLIQGEKKYIYTYNIKK